MMKLVLAITFFAVSLSISLVVFNMMFRDRTTMKVIVNAFFNRNISDCSGIFFIV